MKRDHSSLICDISELAAVFTGAGGLDDLLQKIVGMIAGHMNADVCSIYLFDDEAQELVLKATHGLAPSSVGRVRLKLGEGLTGKAVLEFRAVCEGDAPRSPGFRLFTGIGEEKYCSFLAVPILRGQNRIGAMTLQSARKNEFTPEHVNVFRAITSQLANTIEMAKMLINIDRSSPPPAAILPTAVPSGLKFVKGRSGAEGFAIGESVVVAPPSLNDVVRGDAGRPLTMEDFNAAIAATERQLEDLQKQIETRLYDVASLIFSAQILMLKDRALVGAMEDLIRQGMTPGDAIHQVVTDYTGRFERMSNVFLREKRYDVIDVGRRLLENLPGHRGRQDQYEKKIVVSREMLPSDALKLTSQGALGIVLLSGGVTSHVAVLARSLDLPLVIADDARLLGLPSGTVLLIDGEQGNVYVDPDTGVVAKFREKEELRRNAAHASKQIRPQTLMTDGTCVHLLANINLLGDLAVAKDYRAEGIGLYRTEFPFIIRSDFPTEEEQFVIYRKLVETMKGFPITFRTLDIGGDKLLSYYDYGKEANPFLGLRSIRFSLRHRDVFAQQVRAILRAGTFSPVKIMFPMISSLDEFRAAKALVQECQQQLKSEGIPFQADPEIGVMIELPSAVALADALAREAAFFSVGTNDLIQYTLAVDRTNEKVADLYVPHHPAVLRSLKTIAEAALRHGREISICGDMAHDPRYAAFLVGIGVRTLSLDARYIPRVQEAVCALDLAACRRVAEALLQENTQAGVESILDAGLAQREHP